MRSFRKTALALILILGSLLLSNALAENGGVIEYLSQGDVRPTLGDPGLLEVHLINVQAADCILLRMGDRTMLVDSGNRKTSARIIDYLALLGIDSLDYAFATHPHDDHIGGFPDILAKVPVGTFMQPYLFENFKSAKKKALDSLIEKKNIPVHMVENMAEMYLGEAKLIFLQWQRPDASQNDRSMIVKIELGNRAILLGADIESKAQRALTEEHGALLQSDILKMPHHGIVSFVSEFHGAVRQSLATISNTKDGISKMLRSLDKREIPWMLTTKGTIIAVTDGEVWKVWRPDDN